MNNPSQPASPVHPTVNDGTLLFRAILAHPEEDTPRLVLADWLDESGKPAAQSRARFIREQIRAHREGVPDTAVTRSLFQENWREWFGRMIPLNDLEIVNPSVADQYRHPAMLSFEVADLRGQSQTPNWSGEYDYYCWWLVQRGFVSVVRCHWSHWLRNGETICRSQPLTEVILSTTPAEGFGEFLRWPSVGKWTLDAESLRFWTTRPTWKEVRS